MSVKVGAGVHLLVAGAFPQAQVCLSAQACGFGCTHCTGAYACEDVCIQIHVGGYMIARASVNVCVSGGEAVSYTHLTLPTKA